MCAHLLLVVYPALKLLATVFRIFFSPPSLPLYKLRMQNQDLLSFAGALKFLTASGTSISESQLRRWSRMNYGPRVSWDTSGSSPRVFYAKADLESWLTTGEPVNRAQDAPAQRHGGGRKPQTLSSSPVKPAPTKGLALLAESLSEAANREAERRAKTRALATQLRKLASELDKL